jgi:hypothetical protein
MKDLIKILFYLQKYLWFDNKDEYNIYKKGFNVKKVIGFLINIALIAGMAYMSSKSIPLAMTVRKQKQQITVLEKDKHDLEVDKDVCSALYDIEKTKHKK